jgi:hypothetical protein
VYEVIVAAHHWCAYPIRSLRQHRDIVLSDLRDIAFDSIKDWSSDARDSLYGCLIDTLYIVHRGRNVSEWECLLKSERTTDFIEITWKPCCRSKAREVLNVIDSANLRNYSDRRFHIESYGVTCIQR